MKKTYRIGAIGFAHCHMLGNLESFAACGNRVQLVAAADVPPIIASELTEPGTRNGDFADAIQKYGMRKYDDYLSMIDENPLDIALVCAENAYHPVVSETLLRRGIHVVLEKPMAADMAGALRMVRAADEGNAKIITNWPSTWSPGTRYAKLLCDEGKIGKVFKFTYRNTDSLGPLSYGQKATDTQKGKEWWHHGNVGGGAMLDYCCYGACLSSWFLGNPIAVYGLKANFNSPYASAEDYATITVRFSKSVALLEGSWTTVNSGVANGPILFGMEGTMVVRQDDAIDIFKTRHSLKPDETLTPPPLPKEREHLGNEVLNHLDTNEPLHPTLDIPMNLRAMMILDAGSRSAVSSKMEQANDQTWCIGDDLVLR